jgi:carbon monoxide dehydrogenase subunit G
VSCIAGAELGAVHEDGSFDGTLVVKFGALRVKFAALISLELTEAECAGRLSARGRDGQGATRFNGGATFRVAGDRVPGHSLVTMAGEVNLTGKLASLIESGAGAVVSRMTKEFSAQLIEHCAAPEGSAIPEPGREAPAASPPGSIKAGTAAAPDRGPAGRVLSRWQAWWTRLLRGRRAGQADPGTAVPSPRQKEATSGSAKAE